MYRFEIYIKSHTIRSCVVDNFESKGERKIDRETNSRQKRLSLIICLSAVSGAHYER